MPNRTDHFTPKSFAQENIVGSPSPKALAEGQRLFLSDAVDIENLDDAEAEIYVWDSGTYQVVNVYLTDCGTCFDCECREGRDYAANICRHKTAAAMALRAEFAEHAVADWRALTSLVLETPKPPPPRALDYIGFCLMPSRGEYHVVPLAIPADALGGVDPADHAALRNLIQKQQFAKNVRLYSNTVDGSRFANSTDSTVAVCRLRDMIDAMRYTYSRKAPKLADMLPHLRNCLTFIGASGAVKDVLTVERTRAEASVKIERSADGLRVYPSLGFPDDVPRDLGSELKIVSEQPPWYLCNSHLFEVAPIPAAVDRLIQLGPDFIKVAPGAVDEFDRDFLPKLMERAPVELRDVAWFDVDSDPVPRLYLDDAGDELRLRLRFAYEGHEVGVGVPAGDVSVVKADTPTESGVTAFYRIARRRKAEAERWSSLPQHGLKSGGANDLFALRAKVDPIDFLVHRIPRLLEAGFEVYGQDDLKSIRVNRNKPRLTFSVSSGIDWFDVGATASFGDVDLPLPALYDAIRKRERFVKLADGSIGAIPPEWIERYRHLFSLGEKKGDMVRVSSRQQVLIEDALAQADQADVDAEYKQRRERLRSFDNIAPHPLPQGFVGELRHYQKAGYDWLHFLHEYEFGGCLADDMGIGKTIQTLAFLLSLKESAQSSPSQEGARANLIVMPRSLLFNWEREAAKFTPGLKVLIHAENRTKKAMHFEQYDLVLTTYGILLRDIEMLRKYKFHYAVLDESQAVKNPLSQTGRAVRLINSDHRLTLTGTPVENSTVELWSQFAFLNPGMLGGLDYFQTEFAAAIERSAKSSSPEPGADMAVSPSPDGSHSAQLLRKMVFPFILRRTKDQVAPELPPRTERILYAEMEPEQKALYDNTKARYRDEILGMIDTQGMANSRMKVLEALLRLRQIANHPKLVDPDSVAGSAKFDILLDTLGTVCGERHKALVFSQFTSMLALVRAELDSQKVKYAYLDGSTRNRQEKVDEFQSRADLPLFLISLKAGGVGLNLTAADYVVHIDPWWNPAVERQATDRTHRIGQDKPVFVYKLITRGTVEEKILELQDRKRALADTLISTEESFFKSLTAADVSVLLG